MKKVLVAWVVLSSLLVAGGAWADTVYVTASNDTGLEDGSMAAPFNTIQEGINAATSGDVVSVGPGIYHGAIELKDNVKLVSQQGPKVTIIDGDGANSVVNTPYTAYARMTMDGFTVRNGNILVLVANRTGYGSGTTSMRMDNCIVTDFTRVGIWAGQRSNNAVSRTLIYNPTPYTDTDNSYAFQAMWCNSSPTLKNVTINNTRYGIMLYQASTGVYNTTISNVDKIAATFGNYGFGYVGGHHNNIWNYRTLAGADQGALPVFSWASPLNVDPLFAAAASANYTLQPSSPLIDAGADVGLPFVGSAPDIGAYEALASIPDLTVALAESYQDVPLPAYKNAGEQRRAALEHKLISLLRQLEGITDEMSVTDQIASYEQALDKLNNDIWAKGDGYYGGEPNNDWITTAEEQANLHEQVRPLQDAIAARIADLRSTP